MYVRFKPQRPAAVLLALSAVLAGCASQPKRIEELEAAQSVVAQVAASPRAGVAAEKVSAARQELDLAQKEAQRGNLNDAKYHANVARAQAQIANERILTAQAREALDKATADRERVVAEARARDADLAKQRAASAEQQAASLEQQLKDLQAHRTERGLVLTLGDVLFDTGKATLKPGAYATIDRLASALKQVPTRTVTIEGHTDSVGSDEYNQQLSEQRAMAVQSALMQRGVGGSQIRAEGKGESFPVASNDTPSGRQQNRRVELIFNEGQTQQPSPQVATDNN